jgi:hypothetical protein
LLEGKNNPVEVEKLANELMDLSRHLLELLVAEGERAPELDAVASLP